MQFRQAVHLRVSDRSIVTTVLGSFTTSIQTGHTHGLKASPLTTIQSF